MLKLPSSSAIVREAITVLAGALLAALVIRQLPGVKRWISDSWKD